MTATVTLLSVSTALFTPAAAVDRALHNAEGAKQAWATFCAERMVGDAPSLTIEQVGEALVAAAASRLTKAKAKGLERVSQLGEYGFSTVMGWYYDLRRAHKNGLLPLLLGDKPQSLTGLRRATDSTTANKGRKAKAATTAPTATAPTAPVAVNVTPPSTLAELSRAFADYAKRADIARLAKADQRHLASIIATAAKLSRQVEAHIAAQTVTKAAPKAKRPRKAPTVTVVSGAQSVVPNRRKPRAAAVTVKAKAA